MKHQPGITSTAQISPECDKWRAVMTHRISPWFCAYSGSKATSPDSQMKARMQPLTAPFGTDNGSTWETDLISPNKEKVNGPKCVTTTNIDNVSMSSILFYFLFFTFLPSPFLFFSPPNFAPSSHFADLIYCRDFSVTFQ